MLIIILAGLACIVAAVAVAWLWWWILTGDEIEVEIMKKEGEQTS